MIEVEMEVWELKSLLEEEWDMSDKRGNSENRSPEGGNTVPSKHTGWVEAAGVETELMTQKLIRYSAGSKQHKESPTQLPTLMPHDLPANT